MQLVNRVIDAYDEEDYPSIIKMKDEIIGLADELADTEVFGILLESFFQLHLFEEVVLVGDELRKLGYETYEVLYFMLLSYIGLVDIYQAKALVRRSKLLNAEEIKVYYTNEGANYSNMLSMPYELFEEAALTLLLVNYIFEVSKEMAGDVEVDREYLLFRFFDLINMVYELKYDLFVIEELEGALKIIFEIEM